MNKILTVFTPTYNRKHLLHKCYEALLRQTSKEFVWLVIDDGSTDGTGDLVRKWISENRIEIRYVWQENKGMHGAHNTAHKIADTLLTVCCDSDDYLADDAVKTIVSLWEEKGNETYSGIVGHDVDLTGCKLAEIPRGLTETTLYDLRYIYKLRGDVKLVYRTSLLKEEMYPIYEDEKYLAVGYKYFQFDKKFKLLVTNKTLCFVDYQSDGGTKNKIKKYVEAPRGFMYYRLKMIPLMHNTKTKYWQATHYVSSAIFAKDKRFLAKSPSKLITILALPSGLALNLYIRWHYMKKYNTSI